MPQTDAGTIVLASSQFITMTHELLFHLIQTCEVAH